MNDTAEHLADGSRQGEGWWTARGRTWMLAMCLVLASVSLARGFRNAQVSSIDFERTYATSRLMLYGVNPYELHTGRIPTSAAEGILTLPQQGIGADYFPSALLPVLPFSFLDIQTAKMAWSLFNLALTAWLFRICWRSRPDDLTPQLALILAAGFVMSTPFRVTLGMGQNVIVTIAALVAAIDAAKHGRQVLSGLWLSVGVFKYALAWPFVICFFLADRRWKPLIVAGGIHLGAHLLLCLRMGASPFGIFAIFPEINDRVMRHLIHPSLSGTLKYVQDIMEIPGWMTLLALMLIVLVLATILVVLRVRSSEKVLPSWAWLVVCGMLATLTIHARNYNYVFLAFLWLWAVERPRTPILEWLVIPGSVYLLLGHRLTKELATVSGFASPELVLLIENVFIVAVWAAAFVQFARDLRENRRLTD